ncbi:MAG: GIY-YIG nuclease family protein, partial [Thiotrichaceae bacterium]|nr:GIY-YIG nuclease family protein [Thiotrichaceae bacterium]
MSDNFNKDTKSNTPIDEAPVKDEEQFSPLQFELDNFLKELTSKPGVYHMIDANGVVIYVGKAKNLKKRVNSYFRKSGQSPKTIVMVNQVANIEILVTHTESEALLLENNLIKTLKPRYN